MLTSKVYLVTSKVYLVTSKVYLVTSKVYLLTLKVLVFALKVLVFTLKVLVFTLKAIHFDLSYLPRHTGLPALSREKNFPESQIINSLLTKLFRSRWLDNGLVFFFFCEFMNLDSVSVHKQTNKKKKRRTWSI